MSRSAPDLTIPVGVVVERRKATSPWLDHVWQAVAVLPGAPETAPWTVLGGDETAMRFYADSAEIALFHGDTARYRDNLASGDPRVWVVLRPTEDVPGEAAPTATRPALRLLVVTADPSEGEAHTEAGNDLVEAVPMPASVRAAIDAFVAAHHVEQAFFKRTRDRSDPQALARRGRAKGDR